MKPQCAQVRELLDGEGSVRKGDEVDYRVAYDDRKGAPSEAIYRVKIIPI